MAGDHEDVPTGGSDPDTLYTGGADELRSDRDVLLTLNYLDKIFSTFQRIEDGASRTLRLQVILSVLLLALTTGVVAADENLGLSGIRLELPLWTFIGGGAVAVGVTSALFAIRELHAARLVATVYDGYRWLGFDDPEEHRESGGALESDIAVIAAALSRRSGSTLTLLYLLAVYGVVAVLPLAAQVLALVTLTGEFGWTWHVWLPLGAALILSVWTQAWYILQD